MPHPRNESIPLTPPDDDAGAALFADIEDWTSFDVPWRSWVNGENFAGPFTRGRCDLAAQNCQIFDARLVEGVIGPLTRPLLIDVSLVPSPANKIDHRMRRRERFFSSTRELIGDAVGDDDGLCESNENCLWIRNLVRFRGKATCPH
jgi:hypothetical protein